jgi:hypothetical protein
MSTNKRALDARLQQVSGRMVGDAATYFTEVQNLATIEEEWGKVDPNVLKDISATLFPNEVVDTFAGSFSVIFSAIFSKIP